MIFKSADYTSDGNIWVLDDTGRALRFVDEMTWVNDDSSLTFISLSAGAEGAVFASDGTYLYKLVFPKPSVVGTNTIVSGISAAADGSVFGVTFDQKLVYYNRVTGNWDPAGGPPPGTLSAYSARTAYDGYGVTPKDGVNVITQKADTTWFRYALAAESVSVASDGTVWYIDSTDQVYAGTATQPVGGQQMPGPMKLVAVGSKEVVWAWNNDLSPNSLFSFDFDTNSWIPIGPYSCPAIAADGSAFVSDFSDNTNPLVLRHEGGTSWTWIPVGQPIPISCLATTGPNEFFAVVAGATYHWQGLYWQESTGITQSSVQVAIAFDGTVAVLDNRGSVWIGSSFLAATPGGPFVQTSVGNSQAYFAIDAAGSVYQMNNTSALWSKLPAPPSPAIMISVTDGGVPHIVLKDAQTIMHYENGAWANRDFVDLGLTYFSARDEYHLCGVTKKSETGSNYLWIGSDPPENETQTKKVVSPLARIQVRPPSGFGRLVPPPPA